MTLDAAGQITHDGLNSYTWDDAGRLKTVSRGGQLRATYHYDHKHRRTRKVTTAAAPQGAQTLVYHYDDQDRLIAETTQTGTPLRSYAWSDENLIGQVEYVANATNTGYEVGRIVYYELDHLGTPRQARERTGTVVWRWESDGYGNTLPDEDPDGNGQKTYVYLRFPGQYFDEESGLHYNWHRYYVPRLGRYLSSDPIGVAGGRNSYAYVRANPVRYIDPTGLLCIYNQATGSMVCQDDSTGEIYYNERGYAGTGWGRDDSSAQGQQSVGPIPRGDWRTSSPYNSPNTGPNTIRLTPLPGNTCFDTERDCSSFRVHGNNARNDASHGCIILPRNRIEIPAGETIRVISGDD